MQKQFVIPKSRRGLIIFMVIILAIPIWIASGVYGVWARIEKSLQEHGQPSFNTLPQEQLEENIIVKGCIDKTLGAYFEENKTTVLSTNEYKRFYYLVPIFNENDASSINYFITYVSDIEDYDVLNNIVAYTLSIKSGNKKLRIDTAEIMALPDEIDQQLAHWANNTQIYEGGTFSDWCIENQIIEADKKETIEPILAPFMISRINSTETNLTVLWVCLGFTAAVIIIIFFLIFYRKQIEGIDPPTIKNEFKKVREIK